MRGRTPNLEFRFWVKLGIGIFAALLFMVWERIEALRVEKELKTMQREVDRLTYENGHMEMQVHQWETPSHLQEMAQKEYTMVPVDAAHTIGVHSR